MKIYKYTLQLTDQQYISIPFPATILSVQVQGMDICLWALVEPEHKMQIKHDIRIVGTGHPLPDMKNASYIGTVQQPPFVWHVFSAGSVNQVNGKDLEPPAGHGGFG